MLKLLPRDKKLYSILLIWVVIGLFTGPLAYLIIPVHLVLLNQKGEWLIILLGLWLMLTLSDSRQEIFHFAQTLKIILMGLMGILFFTNKKEGKEWSFLTPFILFFIVASVAWFNSPTPFDSLMKMVSYAILLLAIPKLINQLIGTNRERLLSHLILLGTLILLTGVILKFVYPAFVLFMGERFSGLLGNPNGMGIFGFMFFSMVTIILHYHPRLFSFNEKVVIYALILISMVWAGSRGGLFSSALFLLGAYLFRRNTIMGFILMTALFISYQFVVANFEMIVTTLGLQNYFRLETFDAGAGRLEAYTFMWGHIQEQFWMGKGFGYTEYLMKESAALFEQTGHQGNAHNSYLTIWLDTGLFGLIAFCIGWLVNFIRAAKSSPFVWALLFGLLLSTSVESWLSASLNPFTIQLVIILSLLSNPGFYGKKSVMQKKVAEEVSQDKKFYSLQL